MTGLRRVPSGSEARRHSLSLNEGERGGAALDESADWVEGGPLRPLRIPICLRTPASGTWGRK